MADDQPRLSRSESLHQQVARNIQNDIEAGRLRHDETLKTTRELAKQWGVSVFTINEAMKILIANGLVESRPRSGRKVVAPQQEQHSILRMPNPNVLMIGGYAGSGKTELGRILARRIGWPILDKDTLTRPVVEAALQVMGCSPNDRESKSYLTQIRPREYEALRSAVTENVQCGNSAIVTAPFIRELKDDAWVNRMRTLYDSLGAKVTVVWVYCDIDTMHTYIRHRSAARDASKLDNWPEYAASIDVDFRPNIAHFLVDNSASGNPLREQASTLVSYVLGEAK
ncbi:regulatory protein, gntR family [Actinokineospora diospyrosa]|uniref:Regulatory protein, gntR family n=2 Tax=Actinokineospora diospyrosa TaxID=103728 RepID=A0ABT1I6A7_9PSEU|nr:regulatory protein, gntR family [Actinokineospora diospyrosa]